MDIVSHGLWAVAAGRGATIETESKWKLKWLFFWGIFPDILSFTPMFVLSAVSLKTGGEAMVHRPSTELEPWTPGFSSISDITQFLYQLSHSLVIVVFAVFVFVLIRRSIPWLLLGWPLHILADIPTHSYQFYPTPALWPFWDWKFDGFSWAFGHFTLYNYGALVFVFGALYLLRRLRKNQKNGN